MLSSSSPREVVQIAVGDEACHVAVHWHNLQGLAATDGTCAAGVTHTKSESFYQPRALLVPSVITTTLEDQKGKNGAVSVSKDIRSPQEAQQLSNSLTYGSHSRYRVPEEPKQQQQYQSTGRYVNWDEEEEEGEGDEDGDEEERRQRERKDWERNLQPNQDALDTFWNGFFSTGGNTEDGSQTREEQTGGAATTEEELIPTWRDFLFPPYSPTMIVAPPRTYFSSQPESSDDDAWVQNILWERVRQQLEACDACQGLVLFQTAQTSHFGSALLHEWHDECSSKSPFVGHFLSSQEEDSIQNTNDRVISQLKAIIALDDSTDLADCVVPLVAPNNAVNAARMGAAWESLTTPYRTNGSQSEVSLASSHHHLASDTAPQLSFREFTRSLRRRQGRNLLHMSVYQGGDDLKFFDSLLTGTSCERDQRMRQPTPRPRDATAGSWLNTMDESLFPFGQGMLKDRSMHYHFALSTALRPSTKRPVIFAGTSNLSTCLMQGMGIGYRPEQCMAIVVNQSFQELTRGDYGAGSYWKHLLPKTTTIATVLDNSTLVYPFVHATARKGQDIFSSHRTSQARSIYQRHVAGSNLPEVDDMQTALEHVLDLRDDYTPPEGSGLVIQEDGEARSFI